MTARFVKSATCLLALLALTAVPVVGQQDDDGRRGEDRSRRGPGGRSGGFFGGGMMGGGRSLDSTMIGLLTVPQVREELKLMPDQEEALQKLLQDSRPQRPDFGNLRNAPEAEQREMFEKMRKEAEERMAKLRGGLEEVLLPEQLDRLQEIAIQAIGAEALNDPQVAEALKTKTGEAVPKEKIAEVREKSQDSMRETMRELFSSGDRDAVREKIAEFRKETEQQILNTLSQKQQQAFDEMKGESFELPEDALRGGGRRGGDRGRGERGPRGGDEN